MIVRRCSSKGAFEVIPEKSNCIDFVRIKKNFKVSFEIRALVIIEHDKYNITCYKNGKIMIRNCNSIEEAEKVAEELYR